MARYREIRLLVEWPLWERILRLKGDNDASHGDFVAVLLSNAVTLYEQEREQQEPRLIVTPAQYSSQEEVNRRLQALKSR